ncbi:hypothetical protein E4T43_08557 [Aureobasidium subglaciale]|nr:hypothetical protein E4T43_08557 [Aureobasidium subglaciale]
MKYGHEYAQLLASEGFPEEWISSAISYRLLKKSIKKVQQELSALGLSASTLQHLHSEFGVEAPGDKTGANFVPELWVAVDGDSGEFLDAHLTKETKQYFLWLAQNNCTQTPDGRRASQISLEADGSSISEHEQLNAIIRASSAENGAQWAHVPLHTAANFFDLLDPKLAQLDAIQHAEEKRLESQIVALGTAVTTLTEPAALKKGKYKARSDVTIWRQILALYVQHAIFFSPYERDRGSRSFDQAKSHLELFSKDLVDQGLVKKFREKTSRNAFDHFVTINLDILKAMRFQELNMEAVRKILKKFDKRTALGATKAYQSHANSGPFAKSVATDMCAAMSQRVVIVVPQIDDYSCPVCCDIAWRPIRLECCNTVFCIRCMIELQKSASKCPMCRSTSVITADSGSIDQQRAEYLVKYFATEVKEKQKANELAVAIDKYGPDFKKGPCCMIKHMQSVCGGCHANDHGDVRKTVNATPRLRHLYDLHNIATINAPSLGSDDFDAKTSITNHAKISNHHLVSRMSTKAHPDADLFPHATGLAQKTVEDHQAEQPLKLYAGWFCPFVGRAWTVLQEKNIPYQYIEVNPYHKPESLLKLNPRGLVPTLEYDNKPLYESTVICEFLEEAYPDHGPKLLPEDPYKRARTRIWTDYCTSRIIPSFHRFLQFQPMSDTKGLEEARQEFLGHLKEFTKEMDSEGPYFSGKDVGLIDLVVAPWAVRLWVFDHYKSGLNIPEGGEDSAVWSRFNKWLKAVEERPSVRETTSETEKYYSIYQKYADDKAQSELAKATRKGRGVP